MQNYKTIGEISEQLNIQPHVLRFWETKFKQIKPLKRRGNRRYYSDTDIEIIENIRILLHVKGMTIRGAQKELTRNNQKFLLQRNDSEKEYKKSRVDVDAKTMRLILAKLKDAEKLLKSI